MSDERPGQPRRRGEFVRRAVLDAASAELVEAGANVVSVASIAARAGVHETSIYRRWRTKEALLLEAALELTAAAVPDPDAGSLRGDLLEVLTRMDAFMSTAVGAALLQVAQAAAPDGTSAQGAFWEQRISAQGQLVERASRRGELRSGLDVDLLMRALMGAVHTRVIFGGEPFIGPRAEALVDLLLYGAALHSHAQDAWTGGRRGQDDSTGGSEATPSATYNVAVGVRCSPSKPTGLRGRDRAAVSRAGI